MTVREVLNRNNNGLTNVLQESAIYVVFASSTKTNAIEHHGYEYLHHIPAQ